MNPYTKLILVGFFIIVVMCFVGNIAINAIAEATGRTGDPTSTPLPTIECPQCPTCDPTPAPHNKIDPLETPRPTIDPPDGINPYNPKHPRMIELWA